MATRHFLNFIILLFLTTIGGCDDNKSDRDINSSVTLANLNVLHGFDCDSQQTDTQQCRVSERIALLREHLIAQECPDIITLQEVINRDFAPTAQAQPVESILDLIKGELPNLEAACGFRYQMIYEPLLTVALSEVDEELILSRYPVLQTGTRILYGPLYNETTGALIFARHVLHARVDHPTGELDIFNTHLASGSDFATRLCGEDFCPKECNRNDTARACQAKQLTLFVDQTRGRNNLALIAGDFNAVTGSSEYLTVTNAGWLDSHLAAGQAECDPTTGLECTSGRNSSLKDIENPALDLRRRIDYIFVAVPQGKGVCAVSIADRQQPTIGGIYKIESAGLFAGEPNPFAIDCGSAPAPLCWASNHSGNQVRLICSG